VEAHHHRTEEGKVFNMNDRTVNRLINAALRTYEGELADAGGDPALTDTEKDWYATELELVGKLLEDRS
jgi:hypothetical protein